MDGPFSKVKLRWLASQGIADGAENNTDLGAEQSQNGDDDDGNEHKHEGVLY